MSQPLDYQTRQLTPAGMFTQTAAIFLDAYRELNAKKLFWITMMLSGLIALAFAMISITPEGIKFLVWTLPSGPWNSNTVPPARFYKFVFSVIAIPLWLAWAAMILAVVSTASIFPDFLSSGSVDLYLSRPLSRLRLFLTKYATGLLFVGLQVFAFTLACFLVIGIRGGSWEPALFLAVPIVLLMFSFLFSISVLFGVITRSTIAAILLTMLLWVVVWAINSAEVNLLPFKETSQNRIARLDNTVARWDRMIATTRNKDFEFQREKAIESVAAERETLATLTRYYNVIWWVKLPLPKNGETIDLLRRTLVKFADLPGDTWEPEAEPDDAALIASAAPPTTTPAPTNVDRRRQGSNRGREAEQVQKSLADSRSAVFVIGTSLAFDFVVLSIAAIIFIRRDY